MQFPNKYQLGRISKCHVVFLHSKKNNKKHIKYTNKPYLANKFTGKNTTTLQIKARIKSFL